MNQRLRTTLVSLGILSDAEAEARERAARAERTLAEDLRDLAIGLFGLALLLGLFALAGLVVGHDFDADDATTITLLLGCGLVFRGGAIAWRHRRRER